MKLYILAKVFYFFFVFVTVSFFLFMSLYIMVIKESILPKKIVWNVSAR